MDFLSSVLFTLGRIGNWGILGFYFTKRNSRKNLEKTAYQREMIRAMFLQMGKKPSEAQIKQIMKSVNANR